MPFNPPSTVDWFKHRLLAASRLLYRRQADYFIKQHEKYKLEAVSDSNGMPVKCPICGFLMAELISENGWSASSCSGVGFKQIDASLINNDLSI